MAPPSATTDIADSGASVPSSKSEQPATAPLEVGVSTKQAEATEFVAIPKPPIAEFSDPYKEREYQKGRLALAFRIFAKYGFDEGVAGHITLRVCYSSSIENRRLRASLRTLRGDGDLENWNLSANTVFG